MLNRPLRGVGTCVGRLGCFLADALAGLSPKQLLFRVCRNTKRAERYRTLWSDSDQAPIYARVISKAVLSGVLIEL